MITVVLTITIKITNIITYLDNNYPPKMHSHNYSSNNSYRYIYSNCYDNGCSYSDNFFSSAHKISSQLRCIISYLAAVCIVRVRPLVDNSVVRSRHKCLIRSHFSPNFWFVSVRTKYLRQLVQSAAGRQTIYVIV